MLLILTRIYNPTKVWKDGTKVIKETTNVKIFNQFHTTFIIFLWITNSSIKLIHVKCFYLILHVYPYKVSSWLCQHFLRYVNCQVVLFSQSCDLEQGHIQPKQRTLAALIKVYNPTKFEEIQYHSNWKTANVQISDTFQCTSIISLEFRIVPK